MPSSPARLQIAGSIYIDGGGVMVKHWRNEYGETLLTGLMGRKGAGKTWMVADVQITPNSKYGLDIYSRIYNEEKQRLIHREFRRLISESMELPIKIVQNIKIEGAIEGVSISPFTLQQRISTRAYAGNNVILLGDAVGNSHWSVGGGMQIGAVSHAERLKTLLLDIDLGIPREKALQGYSNAVLNDTKVWAEIGLADFYPSLDKEFIKHAYNNSIAMEKR